MNEQEILFKRLKGIKDYWVESSLKRLTSTDELVPSECDNEYDNLKKIIKTEDDIKAYKTIMNNSIEGVLHSILVMLDGGDELTDEFNIDLINGDSMKSLKENIALHEEFISYLLNVE